MQSVVKEEENEEELVQRYPSPQSLLASMLTPNSTPFSKFLDSNALNRQPVLAKS